MTTRSALWTRSALTLLAAGTLLSGNAARAHDDERDGCKRVQGTFSSHPAAACTSPVGMCTEGKLRGALAGGYEFTMAQAVSPQDGTIPSVLFFSGTSLITRDDGLLVGTDAGAIDLNPFGPGKFSTLITITDGTGEYAGAKGYLQIRGSLDFATGGASGDYRGEICLP